MASVVPTILATNPEEYQRMYDTARSLSVRVHIDISDGKFTDNPTISIEQVHLDSDAQADLHLMVEDPGAILETALSLKPHLIIFHAESQGDLIQYMMHCRELGVRAGIAVLPTTQIEAIRPQLERADHILIFTGNLGHNGGDFPPDQLTRVSEVRAVRAAAEVSVDGGVTDKVASLIALEGVDVLYVGSFLQNAEDPKQAFESISLQAGLKS